MLFCKIPVDKLYKLIHLQEPEIIAILIYYTEFLLIAKDKNNFSICHYYYLNILAYD